MDIENVCRLFELISGEDSEERMPFIDQAVGEVVRMLKDPRFAVIPCIEHLAASLANYRMCLAFLTKEQHAVRSGGGATSEYNGTLRLENARILVAEQKKHCADYIIDKDFVFFGTRG